MTEFNFPQPLRLAAGSHQPGSGKGCAMNVISWENGDTKITDFPECSARPLARTVQMVNDRLADKDTGYLSPEDSITVLEIGHLTVGTAGYNRDVLKRWLHDLLVDPVFGVIQHATTDGQAAIRHVAELLSRADEPSSGEWECAADDAYADAANAAFSAAYAAFYAAYAANAANAAFSAAFGVANADAADAADDAACAAFYAAYAADAANAADFTRWAVQRFRDLMGLNAPVVDVAATEAAVERMLAR